MTLQNDHSKFKMLARMTAQQLILISYVLSLNIIYICFAVLMDST